MNKIKRLKSVLNEARDVEASLKSWTVVDDVRTDFNFNIPKGAKVTYISRIDGGKAKVSYDGKECFVDAKMLKQVQDGQKSISGCACGEALNLKEGKSGKITCRYGLDPEFSSHDDPRDVIWAGGFKAGVDQAIIDEFKSASKKVARMLELRTGDLEIQAKEGKIFLMTTVTGTAKEDVDGVEYRDLFAPAPTPGEEEETATPELKDDVTATDDAVEAPEEELEETPLQ